MDDVTCPSSPVYEAHREDFEGSLRFTGHTARTVETYRRW